MSSPLTPELIEAIETRIANVHTKYQEQQEKDRAHQKAIFTTLSWGVAVAFSVLTYFGVKGFDDLVDRAVHKSNPKEKWEAMMDNVRDRDLVNSLVRDRNLVDSLVRARGPAPGSYTELEMKSFQRIILNRDTSEQTFADVIALLGQVKTTTTLANTLETMTSIVAGDKKLKLDWIHKQPKKQASLISYLAEHKHTSAIEAILPLVSSSYREVQLAAIKYVRDCEVHAAAPQLAKLVNRRSRTGDVRSAAAMALITLQAEHGEAALVLAGLKDQALRSLDDAADTLAQLATVTELVFKSKPFAVHRTGSAALQSQRAQAALSEDPAERALAEIVRAVLLKDYILTVANDFGSNRRFLYLAEDEDRWSGKEIELTLLSRDLVNSLLKNELANGSLDGFKRVVRGLSGIVTKRDVEDIRQEVSLLLGAGEIELVDGTKISHASADKRSRDEAIAAGWNLRIWKLSVNEKGELVAENSATSSRVGLGTAGGRVKSITLTADSTFRLAPVREEGSRVDVTPRRVSMAR